MCVYCFFSRLRLLSCLKKTPPPPPPPLSFLHFCLGGFSLSCHVFVEKGPLLFCLSGPVCCAAVCFHPRPIFSLSLSLSLPPVAHACVSYRVCVLCFVFFFLPFAVYRDTRTPCFGCPPSAAGPRRTTSPLTCASSSTK